MIGGRDTARVPLKVAAATMVIAASMLLLAHVSPDGWPLGAFPVFLEEAFAHILDPLTLSHTGSITNGTGSPVLSSPRGIETFAYAGIPFAVVASSEDDGLQVITLAVPSIPVGVGNITDSGNLELEGATGVDVWVAGNRLYAAVTAFEDNGFQVVDLTDPTSPDDKDKKNNHNTRYLDGPLNVDVYQQDTKWYAAITAYNDNAVQIFDVTDPSSINSPGRIQDNGSRLLNEAYDIKVYKSGSKVYAAVTSPGEDGIQILDITDVASITAAGQLADNSTLMLDGARGFDIVGGAGQPVYAVIAAQAENGIQILDITDPADIGILGSIDTSSNTDATTNRLDAPSNVQIFSWQGDLYAAVTSGGNDAIQILDITDKHLTNPNKVFAGSILDTPSTTLRSPQDMSFFTTGGNAYLAVTSGAEDGVGIIQLRDNTATNTAPTVDAGADQIVNAGDVVTIGSDSTIGDDDGDPFTHYWRLPSFAADHPFSDITLADPTSQTTTFTAPYVDNDEYVYITISVTDHHGAVSSDDIKITVRGNQPPTVDAGAAQRVTSGSIVYLDGSANDPDGHTPLTILWEDASDPANPLPITFANSAVLGTTFIAPQVTTDTIYTLRLTVTDSRGMSADDTVEITVYDPPSKPPVVTVGDNRVVDEGDEVTFTGTARDPEGEAMTYDWMCRSTSGSFSPGNSLSVTFTTPHVSRDTIYTCTLIATDPHNVSGFAQLLLQVRNLPDDGPSLSVTGDRSPIITVGTDWVDPGATCVTIRDSSISLRVTVSGSVDTSSTGTYRIDYTCEHAGRSITHDRTIKVIPTSKDQSPDITITYQRPAVKSNDHNADYGSDAVCRDREDGDISHTITTSTAYYPGRAVITYTCTDSGGHTVTASQNAKVISGNTPPEIKVHGGTIHLNVGDTLTDPGATCTDAEDDNDNDPNTNVTLEVTNHVDTSTAGKYWMIYTCTDSHGKPQSNGGARQVIVTNSNLPPVITVDESDIVIPVNGTWSVPTATCTDKEDDNDDDPSTNVTLELYGVNSVDVTKPGTYRFSYDCTDSAGNFDDVTIRVIVTKED